MPKPSANLIICNAAAITFDAEQPTAQAIAIAGDQILAVGSNDQIRALAGDNCSEIDAEGNTLLPGFIDSHVHLFNGSAELEYLDMLDVIGSDKLRTSIGAYAESCPDDICVFGSAASYFLMGDGRAATRHDLDLACPDRPFACMASDHHTVWANTRALEMAGLLHGAQVPPGSEVVMAADGTATGELRETGAFGPVLKLTRYGGRDLLGYVTGDNPEPAATAAEREADKACIAAGMRHCASYGITGLHNMDGNFYQLELLHDMEQSGTLLCRTEIPLHLKGHDPIDRLLEANSMREQYNSDKLWSRRVKMFMDGVIDSRTAFMLQPYPGTDTLGEPLFEQEQFKQTCIKADSMGLQIAVHAIGDAAVRRTLDGYEAAQIANGVSDSRHRIEHIETIDPTDIARLQQLGVVASLQPMHSPAGGFFTPYTPGELFRVEQCQYAFAWQTIRDTGAAVCFSTDWPVVPVDVMRTVKAAVAAKDFGAPWTNQRQSLMHTLASYTRDNAWLEFNEDKKGQLKAGMFADVALMSHNLEAMPTEELDTARARLTVCAGEITYQA